MGLSPNLTFSMNNYTQIQSGLIQAIRDLERLLGVPPCDSILRTKSERRQAKAKAEEKAKDFARQFGTIDQKSAKMLK